jgi:hypothetical protein
VKQGKHFSTKLLISCELGKNILLILQTPTFVPLFFHMFFQAFEHLTCIIMYYVKCIFKKFVSHWNVKMKINLLQREKGGKPIKMHHSMEPPCMERRLKLRKKGCIQNQ